MQTSKFFKNQRYSHSLEPPIPSGQFHFTNMELYPRKRRTEFYRQASIPEEYQSRDFEHPHSLDSDPIFIKEPKRDKIIPPRNSQMRVIRDSYFS